MTRDQRIESQYRNAMRDALTNLLIIINPQDLISFRAMSYPELIVYARDWLETEVVEISPANRAQPLGLSLEGD